MPNNQPEIGEQVSRLGLRRQSGTWREESKPRPYSGRNVGRNWAKAKDHVRVAVCFYLSKGRH